MIVFQQVQPNILPKKERVFFYAPFNLLLPGNNSFCLSESTNIFRATNRWKKSSVQDSVFLYSNLIRCPEYFSALRLLMERYLSFPPLNLPGQPPTKIHLYLLYR